MDSNKEDKEKKKKEKYVSLDEERRIAQIMDLITNQDLVNASLVVLSMFFLLLHFPFYPIWFFPILLLLAGALGYRMPPLGTIVMLLLAFPAIAYQSPPFAWIFGILLAITMFTAFQYWRIICMLTIIIWAPFSPLGFIVVPLMALSALYFGSNKSLSVSIPAIYIILLLSSIWGIDNSSFLPVATGEPVDFLKITKDAPSITDLIPDAIEAVANLFSMEHMMALTNGLEIILEKTFEIFFADSGLISILSWAVVLFFIGYAPGEMRRKHKNSLSLLVLFLIIPAYIFSSEVSYEKILFERVVLLTISIIGTIVLVFIMESRGIDMSREKEVRRHEKEKKFGSLAVQDLGLGEHVNLKEVGGYEDVKKELKETILWPIEKKELTIAYGIKPPKGILLFGPPGSGKTMIMRALAQEMNIGFYYVKTSDLLSQWFGESERNLAKLFEIAKKNSPCILFFDEIDTIGKKREAYKSEDVGPRLLSTFLVELDGFSSESKIVVIGATNLPHELDRALLRPGRFDKIIYVPLPEKNARKEIFEIYAKKLPIADDIDYEKLASITERYSGADIRNVCKEAARLAAERAVGKNEVVPVNMEDFTKVIKAMKPSVPIELLEEYEKFKMDFERRVTPEEEKKEKRFGWNDVADLEDVRKAFIEAIEIPIMHSELIQQYGIKPPKGILMFGPPGCGKTLVVKAAANEINAKFLYMSCADLMKEGYSGAVEVIKKTFNRAKEQAPSIIFLDEIETLVPVRGYGTPVSEQVVSQLLTELDGVKELKNVVLIGATNRPDILDPALLRPGRFDKVIFVPPPDKTVRKEIFSINLENIPMENVQIEELANETSGFTGADIASICQGAKMILVRRKLKGEEAVLSMADFYDIIKERKPSITKSQLQHYAKFLEEYGERK